MKRTAQGGSIRNFIIVAVLLVGVIAGGVYILKQQNQPAEPLPDEGVTVVEEQPLEESAPEKVEELPGSVVTEELPQTGVAENIGVVLAAGFVSAAIVYYTRSRRPELSL
jgi:LPXTG-motif cell wall-anchored protein